MNTGWISGKDQVVPKDPKSQRNVANIHFYGGYYVPVSVPRRTSAFLMAWRAPAQSNSDAFPSKVRTENPWARAGEQSTLEICQEIWHSPTDPFDSPYLLSACNSSTVPKTGRDFNKNALPPLLLLTFLSSVLSPFFFLNSFSRFCLD